MPLSLIDPRSDELYWPPRSPADALLGTILVARLDLPHLRELPAQLADPHFLPWCPACLILRDARLPLDWVNGLLAGQRQVGVLTADPGALPAPEQVRHAIRRRTPSTPETIVRYVRRRTGHSEVSPALLACFAPEGPEPSLPRSSRDRLLREFGPYTARDWRALHRLLIGTERAPTALERLAHSLGLDPRTLRTDAHSFLGELSAHATEWPGWERKLEAALRVGGYPQTAPQRPRPAAPPRPSAPHQLV
ncbi:MAG: hypothetical protein SF070_11590 [Gemmatimonadota bacterium]|nr:hypothetical protein [Gemmatimonadota bacterium]